MDDIFPEPIRKLPEADIPLNGIKAYLSQSEHHQLLFMQFENDVDLPEHSHAAQIGFVLEGKIDYDFLYPIRLRRGASFNHRRKKAILYER